MAGRQRGRDYDEIPESIPLAPARVPGESLTRFVEEGLVSGQPARGSAGCASGGVSYVKISEGLPRAISRGLLTLQQAQGEENPQRYMRGIVEVRDVRGRNLRDRKEPA